MAIDNSPFSCQAGIHFVTLFPNCPNFGLTKDVGQIPFTLNQESNIFAYLASGEINPQGENQAILTQLPILKTAGHYPFFSGLLFILRYARKIDWLNLYHGGRRCYYWTKLYKFLNPKGKVYLKLDLSYEGCKKCQQSSKEKQIFEQTARAANFISVESQKIWELTRTFTDVPISVIPNGYFSVDESLIPAVDRKKQFITVSRLGTPQKATDILLEAFAQSASEHDWSLKLVGPIEEEFRPQIDTFYQMYPELKKRVTFEGPVFDKATLYSHYRSARTFVLPSLWEASPLVGPEALCNGCRMILSDIIPPIKELTNDLQFGTVVETGSIESLKNALIAETRRPYSEDEPLEIIRYAEQNLRWDAICRRLVKKMEYV